MTRPDNLKKSLKDQSSVGVLSGDANSAVARLERWLGVTRKLASPIVLGGLVSSAALGTPWERANVTNSTVATDIDAASVAMEELYNLERLATIGSVAAAITHELGTPLNVIEGRASMMEAGGMSEVDFRRNARIIAEQSVKMTGIINGLLAFARREPVPFTTIEVGDLIGRVAALAKHRAAHGNVTIHVEAPADRVEISADSRGLLLSLMHLVTNGIQAMPKGGSLTVKLTTASRPSREDPAGPHRPHVSIQVIDEGIGLAEESRAKLFQPIWSATPKNGAVGLGLTVAQRVAKAHGGWIDVESTLGQGSCFTLLLPKGSSV